jgi:hypothetical protein
MPAGLVALAAIILGWAALLARLTRLRRPVLVAGAWWGAGLLALSVWGLAHVIAA